MLFNSLGYLVFLPTVVCLYFLTPDRFRWILLLAASYFFYASWRVDYLALIIASTVVDYGAALAMGREPDRRGRRKWLLLSLAVNLGLLFTFKYANFAAGSLRVAAEQLGVTIDLPMLEVLLPVGISFYTFQTLSYSIDVYRGARGPQRHLGKFAVYVAFFPQLVAGPIERSMRLLPQFDEHHVFDWKRIKGGGQLILWGLFKKLVVADQAAIYVDAVHADPSGQSGLTLLLAAYLFAFQLYCDFSGYSDIAIGSARILGFRLMENFRRPYVAQSVRDFWRRWHISLSTWFRDYVFIPLGGSRAAVPRWALNILITFAASGLWHGANWTFIVWGLLHALYYLPRLVWPRRAPDESGVVAAGRLLPSPRELLQIASTFSLTTLAWVFFRSASVPEAIARLGRILSPSLLSNPFVQVRALGLAEPAAIACGAILLLLVIEWVQRERPHPLALEAFPAPLRWSGYAALLAVIALFRRTGESLDFIYFQF